MFFQASQNDTRKALVDRGWQISDNPHILKCISNIWLTEKTGELEYNDNGVERTARRLHIKRLHGLESKQN